MRDHAALSRPLLDCSPFCLRHLFSTPRGGKVNNSDKRKRVVFVDQRKLDKVIGKFYWSSLIVSGPRVLIYEQFCSQIRTFQEACTRIVITKQRRNHNWLTVEIMNAITYRDLRWKRFKRTPSNAEPRASYRIARNKVVALIRCAKLRYFQRQFLLYVRNPTKTWSLINHLRGKNSAKSKLADAFLGDLAQTATVFNEHFAPVSGATSTVLAVHSGKKIISASAFLPTITFDILARLVAGYRRHKPAGIDCISVPFLQRNFDALSGILLAILNGFLDTATLPTELKTVIVTSLFKGGKKGSVDSYRSISILPILSQIIGKFLLETTTSFLNKLSVISSCQFGFVAGRGNIALLEEFSDEFDTALEQNMFACALFLDTPKAFDTVNPERLLEKLYLLGFRGPFYQFLKNYLYGRSQVISLDN